MQYTISSKYPVILLQNVKTATLNSLLNFYRVTACHAHGIFYLFTPPFFHKLSLTFLYHTNQISDLFSPSKVHENNFSFAMENA